jgi:hypothetical protein
MMTVIAVVAAFMCGLCVASWLRSISPDPVDDYHRAHPSPYHSGQKSP